MGKTAKQVIDFRPSKGFASETSNEIQRKRSQKAAEYAQKVGNYDFTREHLNFEIVKGGKIQPIDKSRSIPQRMRENLQSRGIKDPNEGLSEPQYRTVVNFILGGSRERMHEIAFGSQQVNLKDGADNSHIRLSDDFHKWALDMYRFMADKYGEENIVSCVAHVDELNPHLHITLLPIDERNRFAYKKIFAGKDKYEFRARTLALHDELAVVNAKWGLGRGDDIRQTGAKHRTTEEYRRELSAECTSLEQQLDSDRLTLNQLRKEIIQAETRVKGLTTMVNKLEAQRSDIERQLDDCFRLVAAGTSSPEEMDAKVSKLRESLRDIENRLADKNGKLASAQALLEKLHEDMSVAKQRTDELNAQANALTDVIYDKRRQGVTEAMYNVLMEDFKHVLANADDNTVDHFDESLLMDFARRGNAIAQCALMLLGGYIDQATQFAESHGGGGGGSDMKWGRDPDEDDRRWARRCVRMASQMMKPSSAKKVKR
ncbi:MAG: MobV family relaxase [Bacteroidales bacterium]|nr:MobV family relaxase [Bacteroidales bacterium]